MRYLTLSTEVLIFMKSFHLAEFFSFDIAPYCSTAKFESGQSILEEGSGSVSLYFLSEGRAKLFLTHENGRTSLVSFLDAPCFIGEMEFLGAQQCTNGVTAITPCTCYRIDTAACHEQIMNDAKFLRQLCLFLSKKRCAIQQYIQKARPIPWKIVWPPLFSLLPLAASTERSIRRRQNF